jgi:hypothetical protein
MAATSFAERLRALFRRHLVAAMATIQQALPERSRRSLFRDLSALGYLSSYNHAGRYYTLPDIAQFDENDLWMYQGVFFSRHGTLKATVEHMVEEADDGRTHQELQERLRVRVHNTLLDLVELHRIDRQALGKQYLYVSREPTRATAQVTRRREREAVAVPTAEAPPAAAVIEVLVEVIHGARVTLDAAAIAARLRGRGVVVTVEHVEEVFRRHDLVKKTARSRSRRSRR